MKSERGITLLVLAITIAIMIILASVSFRAFTTNSSPMKQIKNETSKQQNMVEEEKNKIDNVMDSLEEEWGLS